MLSRAGLSFVLVCLAPTLRGQAPPGETWLYVALDGSDAGDGSEAQPFATLERARDEVRRRRSGGPVTIFLRAGIYNLPRTLQLTAQDSGTADAPIVWRNYPGEAVTLSGGATVSGFVPWRGSIRLADASAFIGTPFRQLFYAGARQILARYPNYATDNPYYGGWAYVRGQRVSMYADFPADSKRVLPYSDADARQWVRPEDGEVFIFPRYNWWNNIVRIGTVDAGARTITLAADTSYAIRPGDRYYVQGMFEELDAPGEWFFDPRNGRLYFWPPDGESAPGDLTVSVPMLRSIVNLNGTAYVTFRGLTLEHSAGTPIALTNTTGCLVAGNVIRNAGDYSGHGIGISGGSHNGAVGNDIYNIGANGIFVGGGDRITLTAADNYADNNDIHHTGVFYKQGVGISLGGCGNRASHNYIHDTPRFGIQFSGNNLVMEYNHLRRTSLETEDTGAIYTGGRDWISSRGSVIRYNYIHDTVGFGFENGRWVAPYFSWGIYLDDNAGGVDVIGNIVVRAPRGLINLHNARDTLIENNVFAGGTLQQVQWNGWTDRSSLWTSFYQGMLAGYNSVQGQPAWRQMRNMHIGPDRAVAAGLIMSGNVFRRNIVYSHTGLSSLFNTRNLPLDRNAWSENVYWNAGTPFTITLGGTPSSVSTTTWQTSVDFNTWRRGGPDAGTVIADPLFVDPASDDYRLREESPAWTLGFERIPIEHIGLYEDPLRASWPVAGAGAGRKP